MTRTNQKVVMGAWVSIAMGGYDATSVNTGRVSKYSVGKAGWNKGTQFNRQSIPQEVDASRCDASIEFRGPRLT